MAKTIGSFLGRHRDVIIPCGVILLLGCLALTWFRDGHLISSLDFAFPLDRAKELDRDLYIWDELAGLGRVGAQSMSYLIPYGLFLSLTQVLGLSLLATEKI
ncbi:MAG: hypothetical protein NTU41_12545, partial [Chloroflexi bacterium]|nr:hypothetical protein [Chloroflexota bacterium]